MNKNCSCNEPGIMFLPCSGGTCEGRLACKLPVQKKFDSPRALSPGDRAKSRQLGGKCC
ncbi:MAG: hypothetical protein RQ739_06680 [Desulfotignum sp.]|nr:hypothetical protein [Desulfotignum sp.]